ncbi:hypothetical protein DY000_02046693 [Brassica cretica]|uniref:Uncharacterized protein n=2 Tax=Brassica cretica TaxID=69181 RepID=A0ABQ7EUJ9_BRACR|nr:hypothetical protein DY000_02046693 [Brassica cretica]
MMARSWIDTTMDTHLSDPMGKHLWHAMDPQDFSPPFSKKSSSHCGVGGKRQQGHLSWRKHLNGEKENQRFSLMAGPVMERTSEMVIQSPHLVQLPVRMWERR